MKHEVKLEAETSYTIKGTGSGWELHISPAKDWPRGFTPEMEKLLIYKARLTLQWKRDDAPLGLRRYTLDLPHVFSPTHEESVDATRQLLIALREQINVALRDPWPLPEKSSGEPR